MNNLALAPFHKICPPQLFIKTVELSVLESEKNRKVKGNQFFSAPPSLPVSASTLTCGEDQPSLLHKFPIVAIILFLFNVLAVVHLALPLLLLLLLCCSLRPVLGDGKRQVGQVPHQVPDPPPLLLVPAHRPLHPKALLNPLREPGRFPSLRARLSPGARGDLETPPQSSDLSTDLRELLLHLHSSVATAATSVEALLPPHHLVRARRVPRERAPFPRLVAARDKSVHTLRDLARQPLLPQVVGAHPERPVVSVRHDESVLVEHREELLWQEEKEPSEQHGLNVGDQLRLSNQSVKTGALLQTLDVRDGETDEQVHQDDADQHNEEQDHHVAGAWVERRAILVDKVLIFDLASHHDQHLDQGIAVEALVVGEENGKTESEGDEQAEVGGEKLEEVLGHRGEHLHVDAKEGKTSDHQHQLAPYQEDSNSSSMMLQEVENQKIEMVVDDSN